jgi:sialate O-acetylesterase
MSLTLSPLFGDHAVLQRDQPIPVWGQAEPGEEVRVRLAGHQARVVAGGDGCWLLRLPPLPAGGPHELVASSASGSCRSHDLLVGEVWLCSGQSNMEMSLAATGQQPEPEAHPRIRLLTLATPARLGRQQEIDGRWHPADAAGLSAFSAVAGWFGRHLERELDLPVGLICNAWGGTRIQAWMSREELMQDPLGRCEVLAYEAVAFAPGPLPDGSFASLADWDRHARALDTGDQGSPRGWAAADCPEDGWSGIELPGTWQERGHPGDGVFWFRRRLLLPEAWRGRDLELHLGAIDKHDDCFVQGERIGGLGWDDGPDTWRTPRRYPIPARLADGRLTIALRVRSHCHAGGLCGPAAAIRLHPAGAPDESLPLAGPWLCRREQDWGVQRPPPPSQLLPGSPNAPATLFDSRLAPLIPFALRGVVWYQGESNRGDPAAYRRLLPQLIRDWRRAFAQGDIPFIQVQLPGYGPPAAEPGPSSWAELRDAQLAACAEPACGLAVAIDLGEAGDLHPRNKRGVGERLARRALAEIHGGGDTAGGPLYQGYSLEADGRIRIRFAPGTGLLTRDGGPPRQVAICGPDRIFAWAEAAIEGETLVARHPAICRPVALRYAWSDNPEGCNLVCIDGLPASPFRTDAW